MSSKPEDDMPRNVLRGTPNFIWSVNDHMGQGATGAVFKGRHKRTGDLVAVKTFNMASHLRPLHKREFDVLRKLPKHLNIVRLLAIERESQNDTEVLVMELCTHGSLYNLLDQPENAYGLAEDEFTLVLTDVAAGMEHLRNHGIVHRDIKPGNIMKYEDHDAGKFIYKLIDFGAARELEEGAEFMSLYGTEEYLHPDLYQRAVLRRPMSKRQFGVGVDLWSLGVTLFHASTGQLPFRPYGGRKNRDVMFRITTEKESGMISGIQEEENGQIIWRSELPETCRLSQGFQSLVTPILAGLMECNTERMFTFEQFFEAVRNIETKRVVHLFNVTTGSSMHIYLGETEKFEKFQEMVARQAHIGLLDQQLLYENITLVPNWLNAETEGRSYPKTSPINPIFLYCQHQRLNLQQARLKEPFLPKYPDIVVMFDAEKDVPLAKTCAGIVALVKRRLDETLQVQTLLIKAAIMYSMYFQEEVQRCRQSTMELFKRVEETGKRVEYFSHSNNSTMTILQATRQQLLAAGESNDLDESITNLQHLTTTVPDMYQSVLSNTGEIQFKLQTYFQRRIDDNQLINTWRQEQGCPKPDECVNKVDYLNRVTKRTVEDFRRDRSIKTLSYNEEQIHKFEKSKLAVNGTKAFSILQGHCFPNTKKLFHKFRNWFREVSELKIEFDSVKLSINRVVEIHRTVTMSLDKNQVEQKNRISHVMAQLSARGSEYSVPPPPTNLELRLNVPQAILSSFKASGATPVMEEEGNEGMSIEDESGTSYDTMVGLEVSGGNGANGASRAMIQSLFQTLRELSKQTHSLRSIVIDNDQELALLEEMQQQSVGIT